MSDKQVRVGIGVFIFKNNKFLMMKRRGAHGSGTWAPPGGKMDFNESFEETARREVKEETGLEIKNVRFGAATNDLFPEDEKHFVTIWMLSDYAGGEEQIMEPEKCSEMQWSTFDALPSPLFSNWKNLLVSEFIDTIKKEAAK